jgi:hypothetical protein
MMNRQLATIRREQRTETMLSVEVEKRFTVPGYRTIAYTLDGVCFRLQFENKETGFIDDELTTTVYARYVNRVLGTIVTQSLPFSD